MVPRTLQLRCLRTPLQQRARWPRIVSPPRAAVTSVTANRRTPTA